MTLSQLLILVSFETRKDAANLLSFEGEQKQENPFVVRVDQNELMQSFHLADSLAGRDTSTSLNDNRSTQYQQVLFKTQNYVMTEQKSTKLINSFGREYYGQVNDKGQAHGFGCCVFADGNYYEGEWENDEPNGYGGMVSSDGD